MTAYQMKLVHALSIAFIVISIHAQLTSSFPRRTVTSCSDIPGCLATSGCRFLQNHTPSIRERHRYSLEHVRVLIREFRIELAQLVDSSEQILDLWLDSSLALPVSTRGLRDLYPTVTNTSGLTNATLGDQHRILRELRWWLTRAEAHTQLIRAADILDSSPVMDITPLERAITRLSRSLNSLLNTFSVDTDTVPAQCFCVESPNRLRDSVTQQAEFTSMALRDIHQMALHIKQVLENCDAERHDQGRHRVKLDCWRWSSESAFYSTTPSGWNLYSLDDFTTS